MIKAVLWDNDGVLVDTERLFYLTTQSAFARLGLQLDKQLWATRYLGQGQSSRDIAVSLGADPARLGQILEERNQEYRRVLAQPPPVLPQVRETLAALARRLKLGLVTGCHRDQLCLVHGASNLLGFFDCIVTGDDCSEAKPHPGPYLAALKALRVAPGECVAIEDSPRGLASARAAGIACLAVPTELTQFLEFPGALGIAADVSAVLKYLTLP